MPNTATDNISAALQPDRVAVITGAASGIGLATAKTLAGRGLKVVIADREGPALYQAIRDLAAIAAGGEDEVLGFACDVSRPDDVEKLADAAYEKFGEVAFLMNNAGIGANPGKPWENREDWKALIEVNFWGAVYGVEAFAPRMIEGGAPGLIVNTGSKQGITTPPGNLAYNVSKAALKTFHRGTGARIAQHRRRQAQRASADPRLHLYRADDRRRRQAGRRMDRRAGCRLHARAPGARRFLHPVPRQRDRTGNRRAAHGMGGRRHHREPPGFVALAPGLQGRLREVPHGMTVNCGRRVGQASEGV